MISVLAVENYRSLRRLVVPLRRLNVVTGANGSGKTSLYRTLRLLADSASNGVVSALAREGGIQAALWAGPKAGKRKPVALRLGFAGEPFGYAMDLGLRPPQAGLSKFNYDPQIQCEAVWNGPVLRPSAMLAERWVSALRLRQDDGGWKNEMGAIRYFDSMLSEVADPQRAPELLSLREQVRSWRFYDHVRTDAQAPARSAPIGTRTPVLGDDGADLAAVLQTIREYGDPVAMDKAIDQAFPGSRVEVVETGPRFELELHQPGLLRPLSAAELSDGTLRYLLWVAALLSPRPPQLLVLNEPETSLHPELLAPLADLITEASARAQTVVVTHSRPLATALEQAHARTPDDLQTIELVKESGETTIAGQGLLDEPPWHWPKR